MAAVSRQAQAEPCDILRAVGYHHWKSNDAKDTKIGQVVANEGDVLFVNSPGRNEIAECGHLTGMRVLHHIGDPELGGAQLDGFRDAPGDDRDLDARELEHLDAESIPDVEALEFDPRAIHVAKVNATFGEDAVDVEHDEANALCDFC